jgi:peptide/nickel transport system substrate-binding protein
VRLFTSDPWLTNQSDGHQTERVATSWTWNGEATTLHLKLRSNVYFHDGTRLTPALAAEALKISQKRRDVPSLSSVTSIEPSGEDAVDLHLSEVNSFLLSDLSGVLVVEPGHDQIGTGPFAIVRQSTESSSLVAFAKYYRGAPGVSAIEIMNYPTQRNAWTALMRGEIDMLHEVSRDAAEFVEAQTTVRTYSFPRPYYIPLVFNVRHPVLQNVEVRKAINEALDRDTLVRDGLSGRGAPADGPVFPQLWAYSFPSDRYKYDAAAARQRLDNTGVKSKPAGAGYAPTRFSFSCLLFADDTRFERLALLVQKQLADVGIEMKLEPLHETDLVARVGKGDFDAFLFEMAGRSLVRVYEFWRSHQGLINTGYTAADDVLDRIKHARSEEETKIAVAALERVMHDDPPAAFLAWQSTMRAVSSRFDVAAEKDRDILANVWQWRPVDVSRQASR